MTEKLTDGALLPCPFCGGPDTRLFNRPDEFNRTSRGVQCANGDCFIKGPEFETEAEAIAAWNRRAAPTDDLSVENENLRLRLSDWMGRADMAGRALERVLAGEPVRNADEIVSICKRHVQKENDA